MFAVPACSSRISYLPVSGTPPRIDGRTINYSVCRRSNPDTEPMPFSFLNDSVWLKVRLPSQ